MRIFIASVVVAIFCSLNLFAQSEAEVLAVNPHLLDKMRSTWDLELQGHFDLELNSAQELARISDDGWMRNWAEGVATRLTSIGKPVDIAFTALDGAKIDLRDMKGKVVLIDFWATWCPPCLAGLPTLKDIYARFHPRGLNIIGVSWDLDRTKLTDFIRQKQISWPQYFDGTKPNRWGQAFGVGGVPYVLLIDKSGRLQYFDGSANDLALKKEIEKLITE